MPCTVIRPDDMADNILNRDKHPGMERPAHEDGVRLPCRRKAVAALQRAAGREPEDVRGYPLGDRVLRWPAARRWTPARLIAWPERFNHDEFEPSSTR
jgi:hypothetical protein